MADHQALLVRLGPALRRAILRHYTPDSCVASSAIGKLILDSLGIPCEPLSVKLMLANQAFVQCLERYGHVPQNAEERERWFVQTGAHALGLGMVDPNWQGPALVNGLHLALLVDGSYLWDLSIDQASRPAYGIVIKEPFLGDLSNSPRRRQFLRGQEQIVWEAPGHGVAVYGVKPKDKRYLKHPNWREDGTDVVKRNALAQEALLALRDLLSQG
jgi:hypothetical protein